MAYLAVSKTTNKVSRVVASINDLLPTEYGVPVENASLGNTKRKLEYSPPELYNTAIASAGWYSAGATTPPPSSEYSTELSSIVVASKLPTAPKASGAGFAATYGLDAVPTGAQFTSQIIASLSDVVIGREGEDSITSAVAKAATWKYRVMLPGIIDTQDSSNIVTGENVVTVSPGGALVTSWLANATTNSAAEQYSDISVVLPEANDSGMALSIMYGKDDGAGGYTGTPWIPAEFNSWERARKLTGWVDSDVRYYRLSFKNYGSAPYAVLYVNVFTR